MYTPTKPPRRLANAIARAAATALLMSGLVVAPTTRVEAATAFYLPWTNGTAWHVSQGNGGSVSHFCTGSATNCYALDFDRNAGLTVRASAPGTIISIRRTVNTQDAALGYGNYVVLQHDDGTCTRYAHMQFGSVTAKGVGSPVGQAEPLGLVGNTGYTLPIGSGHHLHFQRENCASGISTPIGFVELGGATPVDGGTYTSNNVEIPDTDSDGLRDNVDRCTVELGVAQNRGCPFEDGQGSSSGDFNGDGYGDMAVVYDYGGGDTGIWEWQGGPGGTISARVRHPFRSGTGFEWDHSKIGVSDTNGDGYDDLLVFYNYPTNTSAWLVFSGTSAGLAGGWHTEWRSAAGSFAWTLSKVTTGDFNGDGYGDALVTYRYGQNDMGIWEWQGGPGGLNAGRVRSPYRSGTGFEWDRIRLAVADVNGDGYDDLATFYNYGGNTSAWIVFNGTAAGLASNGWTRPWISAAGAWSWDAARVTAGDYDGDGIGDLAVGYRYGASDFGIWEWRGTTAGLSSAPRLAYRSGAGFEWDNSKLATCNANGDRNDDFTVFYNYGASTSAWINFPGTAGGIQNGWIRPWLSVAGSFGWPNSRIAPCGGDAIGFRSINPARLAETRSARTTVDGQQNNLGRRAAGTTTQIQVTGRASIAANAAAVSLIVTATGAATRGGITVFACGTARPVPITLQHSTQLSSNTAMVRVGVDGKICVYNSVATDFTVDVTGYYVADSAFRPLTPARLLETRPGRTTVDGKQNAIGRRTAASVTEIAVTGRAGAPANARAASLNITVIGAAARGSLTVYPCGTATPITATVNFDPTTTFAQGITAKLGTGGKVCVLSSTATDLVVDITGVHLADSTLRALSTVRLLETRAGRTTVDGVQNAVGRRAAGTTTQVQVTGRAGVTDAAGSVTLSITAASPSSPGVIIAYPCGAVRPNAMTMAYSTTHRTASVTLRIGVAGKVCVYNSTATDLLVDLSTEHRR